MPKTWSDQKLFFSGLGRCILISVCLMMAIGVIVFLILPAFAQTPCYSLDSSRPIPTGFGAPYNLFSQTKETLITADCDPGSATFNIGNGSGLQYIYNTAYLWQNSQWQAVSLTPQGQTQAPWIIGRGRASINLTAAQLQNTNNIIAYICNYIGNQWKCGCRDSACTNEYWQIQRFKVTSTLGVCTDNDGDRYITETTNIGTCGNICGPDSNQSCLGNNDCNDSAWYMNAGAPETCDGNNNDCDSQTDEGCDDDNDDYCDNTIRFYNYPIAICPNTNLPNDSFGNDCNDSNILVYPGATEICGNSIDDDCDSSTDCGDTDCSANSACVGVPQILSAPSNVIDGQSVVISGSGFGAHQDSSIGNNNHLVKIWEDLDDGGADCTNDFDKVSWGPELRNDINLQRAGSNYNAKFFRWVNTLTWTNVCNQAKTGTWMYGLGVDMQAQDGLQQVLFFSSYVMFPQGWDTNFDLARSDAQVKVIGATSWQSPAATYSDGPKTYFAAVNYPAGGYTNNPWSTLTEDGPQTTYQGNTTTLMPEGTWHRLDIWIDTTQSTNQKFHRFYVDGKRYYHSQEYYREGACGAYECPEYFKWINYNFLFLYHLDDNYPWPIYMDDFFVDYTPARVEICNTSIWDESIQKHCEIQIPTIWTDGSITIDINQGSFQNGETAYLFVIDEDGNVSNGRQVIFN